MTQITSVPPAPLRDDAEPFRVIIVDDSIVIRGWIKRTLETHKDIKIVGTASDGKVAVELLKRTIADVVILDIEMPVMDGLTAIPHLKAVDPAVQIVMASTLTKRNADISLKALSLGATDYIPKPEALKESDLTGAETFGRDLVEKIRALSIVARRQNVRTTATPMAATAIRPIVRPPVVEPKTITLRPMPMTKPDIIVIGSSTGGPQALFEVIKAMGAGLPQPIVITQHMPPNFTTILAEHIARQCTVVCTEAKDDDLLKPGHYYVAPGDFHMMFVRKPEGTAVKLTKDPPENFCRPAVDAMLRSVVEIYKGRILTVMLTGMGQDGLKSSRLCIEAGGAVIAQDEATSVVWGMPGAVAMAGICSAVLPLNQIGQAVRKMATGSAA